MIRNRKKHNKENIPATTSTKTLIQQQLKPCSHNNSISATDRGLKGTFKRTSFCSLAYKNSSTRLPLIARKKDGTVLKERRRIVTEDNRHEDRGNSQETSPFYHKIFKFKEIKSIDSEFRRLEEFKSKNQELRRELGGL
jgi:hypothetical protein